MRLTILGSGTCIPHKKRNSPGYSLEIGDNKIIIDPGSGTLNRLGIANINLNEISLIFFSHCHVDHTADLIPILFAKKNSLKISRQKDISLFGFKGFRQYFTKLQDIYKSWITSPEYSIIVNEFNSDTLNFHDWKVRIKNVKHTDNSVGFRFIENNKILSYSGDSDYCRNLIELSQNADIALLECSFPESYNVPEHLTPQKAGQIASEAGVKKLILTHLYPVYDSYDIIEECRKTFSGIIEVAEDLNTYIIN